MIYASTHGAHRYAAMLLRWNHSEQRTLIELQALTYTENTVAYWDQGNTSDISGTKLE